MRIEVGPDEVAIGVAEGIFERDYGTAAAVLVELGRRLIDMKPGKLEIEITRKEVDEAR